MSIYELTKNEIRLIPPTTFRDANVQERTDLQRLLREHVSVIAPKCLVIAEEFGEWDESRRRIDLLAIDTDANIIVIELKRTEDGGHMELQAVRYASMVATMTFEQAVRAYAKYLTTIGSGEDAETNILEHLGWVSVDEEKFAQEVRIVLASAQFSKELTSTVLWLNDRGLDIRCVKLRPHNDAGRVLLDVQQVIPLPEAEDYQVRVREKNTRERESRQSGRDMTKFIISLAGEEYGPLPKRETVLRIVKYLCECGVSPDAINNAVSVRKNVFRSAPGQYENTEAFIDAIVKTESDKGKGFDSSRWYLDDQNRIEHGGNTYVLNNGWGKEATQWLTELTEAFAVHNVKFWAEEEQ